MHVCNGQFCPERSKQKEEQFLIKNVDKEKFIKLRIENSRKENWKKQCEIRNISLTSLIIDAVENRILEDERSNILTFIEKQDNMFVKIETNINQIAKIVNTQKSINNCDLANFSEKLNEITILKKQQNEMFEKIYSMLAK